MSVFSTLINFVFPENLTEVTTQCTESGLWQQIDFTCLFDPLAVNLKQGTNIFGGKIAHSLVRLKKMTGYFAFLQQPKNGVNFKTKGNTKWWHTV
jgi:hypothetical protein